MLKAKGLKLKALKGIVQSKKCIRGILYYGKDSADTLFLYLTFESLGFMVEEKKSKCKETD